MKRIAVICLLVILMIVPLMGVSCDSGGDDSADRADIEDTIIAYYDAYNASDFDKCITYLTDYDDEEDTKAALAFFRELSGELYIRVMSSEGMLHINILEVDKSTAWVEIGFASHPGGSTQSSSGEGHLKKVDGQWKLIWEMES